MSTSGVSGSGSSAEAETRPIPGPEFLNALALGIEIQCRLSNVLLLPPARANLSLYVTGLTGPIGAAIALGRVRGFEGAAIRGSAEVRAEPGRLHVQGGSAELDGLVVLRYHSVPCLRSHPPVRLEPVPLKGDPVPFIGLRPGTVPVVLELDFPP